MKPSPLLTQKKKKLQNATDEMRQLFQNKIRQKFIKKCVSFFTKCDSFIGKSDICYKMWQLFYKMCQLEKMQCLLQNALVHSVRVILWKSLSIIF